MFCHSKRICFFAGGDFSTIFLFVVAPKPGFRNEFSDPIWTRSPGAALKMKIDFTSNVTIFISQNCVIIIKVNAFHIFVCEKIQPKAIQNGRKTHI
jgi:hypothetical protein